MRNVLSRIDGRRVLLRVVLPACVLTLLMVGIGLLITRVLTHDWPFTVEDGVDRAFAAHRTATWNDISGVFSTGASTPWAVPLAIVAVIGARLFYGRWREAAFIAVAMAVEVSVFLLTTLMVHRARPGVPELDVSPPTSSYPSGHSAAALALYGAVALLIYLRTRRRVAWLLLLIPLAVAGSRLYRGMHHPSDVIAGLLLGTLSLVIAKRAVLDDENAAGGHPVKTAARRNDRHARNDRHSRATAGARARIRNRSRTLGGAR